MKLLSLFEMIAVLVKTRRAIFKIAAVLVIIASSNIHASAQQGNVPDIDEYNALRDFYLSTNGANWINKTNWPTTWTTPVGNSVFGTWAGVAVVNGDVIQIEMNGNNLNGPLPESIGKLKAMTNLTLEGNNLTGGIPASLGDILALSKLDLYYNQLTGSIPASLCKLTNLSWLSLNYNNLSGKLPDEIGNLSGLFVLFLGSNQLSGPLPPSVCNLTEMRNFQINSNHFSGPLPEQIGKLTKMGQFFISANQFSGELPASIKDLSSLAILYINQNNFSGNLPTDIFSNMNLQGLDVSENNFTGPFPSSIGHCTSLTGITAHLNKFTSLPPEVATLPSVSWINFDQNMLISVPSFASSPAKAGMTLFIPRNRLEFSYLETIQSDNIGNPWFAEQREIQYPTPVLFPVDGTLTIPTNAGLHSTVTWEKWNGSNWQNINSSNEDATQKTYKRTSSPASHEGTYRWRMTNSVITSMTLESSNIVVTSQGRQDLDSWTFLYKYDERKRMTHKKVPGADWVYMVYDDRDRLVLTQDGNQRLNKQWFYTTYDELNRPVLTGIYTHGSPVSQEDMNLRIVTVSEQYNGDTNNHGYSNTPFLAADFNASGKEVLTAHYYDNYAFKALLPNPSTFDYLRAELPDMYNNGSGQNFSPVMGQRTGSKIKVLSENKFICRVNYYDENYRVVQTATQKMDGGIERLSNVFDFTGKVLQTKTSTESHGVNKISWKYPLDVTIQEDGIIQSTQGGWGTSGAISDQQLEQGTDGWIEATYKYSDRGYTMFGFSESATGSGSTPDYSFYLSPDKSLGYSISIFEKGQHKFFYNTLLNDGAKLRVERKGSGFVYKVNGLIVYTSLLTSSLPLVGKVTFANEGILSQPLCSFRQGAIKWQDLLNVTVGTDRLTQTVPDSWGTSGASSSQLLAAGQDGWLEFTFTYNNPYSVFGFSTTGGGNSMPEYGIYANKSNGNISITIWEYGGHRYFLDGLLAEGARLRIERTAGNIYYKVNGSLIYTSPYPTSAALRAKASFATGWGLAGVLMNPGCSFCGDVSTVLRTFEYDHADRPVKTFHSINDATPVLLVKNEYNELGQLIDKKLHSTDPVNTLDANRHFKQSIDYRYNIRGWLTKINDSDLQSVENTATDDANTLPDLFGMELGYNAPMGTGNDFLFNGNISVMKWSNNMSLGAIKSSAYNYDYDAMNRIKSASFFKYQGSLWNPNNSFSESNYNYDLNGNIMSLKRNGSAGDDMDDLTYTYVSGTAGSNKLLKVTDAVAGGIKGFIDGNKIEEDYAYDANGNMVVDKNKKITFIEYNHLNLPAKITKANGDYLKYTYDASGKKLLQEVFDYANQLKKKSDYDGEYFFENDTLKFVDHEEGRIVMKELIAEYQYHLKDHLGNIRTTFTSKDDIESNAATIESSNYATEHGQFLYLDQARRINARIFDHTHTTSAATGTFSIRLSGSENEKIGLAKSLSVMPGDKIDIEVFGKFVSGSGNDQSLLDAIAAIAGTAGGSVAGAVIDGVGYTIASGADYPFTGLLLHTGPEDTSGPKAYLNYFIVDRNFAPITGGFKRLTSFGKEIGGGGAGLNYEGAHHERLFFEGNDIVIKEPGYVYIWLSNEETSAVEVYFDDFKVTHIKSPVIATDDYYAGGATFNSYVRENTVQTKFRYQSKEFLTDLGLDVYDFGWRNYDPYILRTTTLDPHANYYAHFSPYSWAANNPVSVIDPDGRDVIIGANAITFSDADAENLFSIMQSVAGNSNEEEKEEDENEDDPCKGPDCDKKKSEVKQEEGFQRVPIVPALIIEEGTKGVVFGVLRVIGLTVSFLLTPIDGGQGSTRINRLTKEKEDRLHDLSRQRMADDLTQPEELEYQELLEEKFPYNNDYEDQTYEAMHEGNNQKKNQEVESLYKELGLTDKDDQYNIHRMITKKGYSRDTIKEIIENYIAEKKNK